MRRIAVAALAIFAVVVALAQIEARNAASNSRRANEEAERATFATNDRIAFEQTARQQRALADAATAARRQADTDRNTAIALQKKAAAEATKQQQLAAQANLVREQAEHARDEALRLKTLTEKELKKETAVAESQEKARQARALREPESRLRQAILAAETARTEAAQEALAEALDRNIRKPASPYTP